MTRKAPAHAYGNVKGARSVPAMKTDALGRAKAKAPSAAEPAGHVVAPAAPVRRVTAKTMGKRLK